MALKEKTSAYHGEEVSLVAQMVKNLPAMQETQIQVQSLGQEDPLEQEMAVTLVKMNPPQVYIYFLSEHRLYI